MELLAVIVGLEALKKPNQNVTVFSDSKYVVDAVMKKWVFGWEKKNFKGKKNADLWKRFLQIYPKQQIQFQYGLREMDYIKNIKNKEWIGKRVLAMTRFGGYAEYAKTVINGIVEISKRNLKRSCFSFSDPILYSLFCFMSRN